jgi:hypothetical protein
MKSYLFFNLLLGCFSLQAQGWNEKFFGGKNQFELGSTFSHYPNADFGKPEFFTKYSNYRKHNYFLGYTRIVKGKYTFTLDFISGFTPNMNANSNLQIGEIISSNYKMCNLSLGKLFKFSRVQLNPKLALSYRFWGGQWTTFGYRNPGSAISEPLFAFLSYNSIGFSIGNDVNYFFNKHLGIGFKTFYNVYPFENAKLSSGSLIDQPDPFLVETHKPLNQLFILNFKLMARL